MENILENGIYVINRNYKKLHCDIMEIKTNYVLYVVLRYHVKK